jgi:hypothetical protein
VCEISLRLEAAQHRAYGGFFERAILLHKLSAHLVGVLHPVFPDQFQDSSLQLA